MWYTTNWLIMYTKTTMLKLQKQKILLKIFLGIIALLIIISSLLTILTPEAEEYVAIPNSNLTKKNIDNSKTSFSGLVYVGPTENFQALMENVSILSLQTQNSKTDLFRITNLLSEDMGFSIHEELTNTKVYLSSTHLMQINMLETSITITELDQISQNHQELPSQEETQIIDPTSAESLATAFVEKVYPEENLVPLTNKLSYFEDEPHLSPTTPESAAFIEIPYAQAHDKIPIYRDMDQLPPVRIMVNKNNSIQKVVISPFIVDYQVVHKAKLLSINEALELTNIMGVGSIIFARHTGSFPYSLANITSGTLTEVALEYRVDTELQLIYPFYRFFGELTNDQGDVFEAQIITPAVQVQAINSSN